MIHHLSKYLVKLMKVIGYFYVIQTSHFLLLEI